jgi:ATP-dependent DNA ligase
VDHDRQPHGVDAGARLWREGMLEGIVAKRLDEPYRPGWRGAAWLKLKHPHARDQQRLAWAASPAR